MKSLISQNVGLLGRASLAFLLKLDFGMQLGRTVGGRSNLRGNMKGNEP